MDIREDKYIEFDLTELLEHLLEHRDEYCKSIIDIIPLSDEVSICVMPLTRGEYRFIQQEFVKDPDASLSILTAAISSKALIKDGVANIMSLPQRIELNNTLPHDIIRKLIDVSECNNKAFFKVINEFIKSKTEHAEQLNISDFILFFYGF